MKLGILTIATNKYLDYFSDLVESMVSNYPSPQDLEWFLFTDRDEEALVMASQNLPFKLTVIPIQPLGFPEATLLRYEIYSTHESILGSDILLHLDADMLIKSNEFITKIIDNADKGKLCLVKHPGFYRPKGSLAFKFYFLNPAFLVKDSFCILKNGGLGAWEMSKKSKAYVPRRLRKKYFCGGIWFGKNYLIKTMLTELSNNVQYDLDSQYIARWHDESYLNAYSLTKPVLEQLPELCFEPRYKNLKGIHEIVRAVDKNA